MLYDVALSQTVDKDNYLLILLNKTIATTGLLYRDENILLPPAE